MKDNYVTFTYKGKQFSKVKAEKYSLKESIWILVKDGNPIKLNKYQGNTKCWTTENRAKAAIKLAFKLDNNEELNEFLKENNASIIEVCPVKAINSTSHG